MSGDDCLQPMVVSNVFFNAATAYAILRNTGVAVAQGEDEVSHPGQFWRSMIRSVQSVDFPMAKAMS
jgi:hypothetical protein